MAKLSNMPIILDVSAVGAFWMFFCYGFYQCRKWWETVDHEEFVKALDDL